MSDNTHVEFDLDGAMGHVRQKAVGFLQRAAITVVRRAKELLSVPGTLVPHGVTQALHAAAKARQAARQAHQTMVRENREFARDWNQRYKAQIQMGELKKLRVTKAGHLTDRAKAGSMKTYYKNVGGKMVKHRRKKS